MWNKQILEFLRGYWVFRNTLWKKKQNAVYKKRYNIKINKDFRLKFVNDSFETTHQNLLKIEVSIFRVGWESACERALQPGRFIKDTDYMVKKKHFCFVT